jgi:hypothetical protein
MTVLRLSVLGLVAVLILGGGAAFALGGDPQPQARPASVDISGPCDEAEHVGDPRCEGRSVVTEPDDDRADGFATGGATAGGAVDISGPCDEAEHVGDPRCTGALDPDDSSHGRIRGDDEESEVGDWDDDSDDDSGHSGDSNSGHSGDSNSGHSGDSNDDR